jgi:hypothetical protein
MTTDLLCLTAGSPKDSARRATETDVGLEELGRGAEEEGSPRVADVHEAALGDLAPSTTAAAAAGRGGGSSDQRRDECRSKRRHNPEHVDGTHGCLLDGSTTGFFRKAARPLALLMRLTADWLPPF